jgi:hypothetical protein
MNLFHKWEQRLEHRIIVKNTLSFSVIVLVTLCLRCGSETLSLNTEFEMMHLTAGSCMHYTANFEICVHTALCLQGSRPFIFTNDDMKSGEGKTYCLHLQGRGGRLLRNVGKMYRITLWRNPKYHSLHLYLHENLKSNPISFYCNYLTSRSTSSLFQWWNVR